MIYFSVLFIKHTIVLWGNALAVILSMCLKNKGSIFLSMKVTIPGTPGRIRSSYRSYIFLSYLPNISRSLFYSLFGNRLVPSFTKCIKKVLVSLFLARNELTPGSFPTWLKIRPQEIEEKSFNPILSGINPLLYCEFHGFRLLVASQLFSVHFDQFRSELHFFRGSWGSSQIWIELKIKRPLSNLAWLNLWNALYY